MIYKTYIFINGSLYLTELENRTKNLYHSSYTTALSKGTTFAEKNAEFLQKNVDISKIKQALELKSIFPETTYVYFCTKFQVPSIILTSFSQGVTNP